MGSRAMEPAEPGGQRSASDGWLRRVASIAGMPRTKPGPQEGNPGNVSTEERRGTEGRRPALPPAPFYRGPVLMIIF